MQRRMAIQVLLATCWAVVGCGSSDMPLVPVTGQVTFAGGPCPAPGRISFSPAAGASTSARPAWAKFDTDGQYAATSFTEGDGLLPGRYHVTITCYNGLPDPRNPDSVNDINLVPKDFRPDELVVEEGQGPIQVNYDVPLKKT
jgi:hypothetical protein